MDGRSKPTATSGDPLSQTLTQCTGELLELNAVRVDLPQFDIDDMDPHVRERNVGRGGHPPGHEVAQGGSQTAAPVLSRGNARGCQSPLAPDCYDQLTRRLREHFGLTHAVRLQRLKSLPPTSGALEGELEGERQLEEQP
uniref:Uncharacterized protein n=1 Tax=Trichuris muris TaxID=70415 RepID=A0A5S6R3Y5_TRIMR